MNRKRIALLACLALVFSLFATACGGDTQPSPSSGGNAEPSASQPADNSSAAPEDNQPAGGGTVQGVTDTEILVGNTAETTGSFAAVGVPFNAGLEAAYKEYNDAGGFHGKKIRLIHYDAGGDGAQGLTYTKQLVEDDKVFALSGHFGTWTVAATMDYMEEKGVPMVYAATGTPELYHETTPGCCIFPVQPIYEAEGRVLLARALAPTDGNMGLGGTKIGCIATTDDCGEGLKYGVQFQAEELGVDVNYQDVDASATDYSAAVNVLKNAGCDVVILAGNQAPMSNMMASMRDANYNAKCITSYVSASVATMGALVDNGSVTADRPLYSTAWMDTTTEEGMGDYTTFAGVQAAWEAENGVAAEDTYVLNSYAMAGYVAGKLFIHGLNQLDAMGLDLTWENYIKALEEGEPFHIPMGGELSFANGDRLGVTSLAMNTIGLEKDESGNYTMAVISPIMSLPDVLASIK